VCRVGSHRTNGFVSSRLSLESSSRPHEPSATSPSTPTGAARAQPPLGELVGSPAPPGGRRGSASGLGHWKLAVSRASLAHSQHRTFCQTGLVASALNDAVADGRPPAPRPRNAATPAAAISRTRVSRPPCACRVATRTNARGEGGTSRAVCARIFSGEKDVHSDTLYSICCRRLGTRPTTAAHKLTAAMGCSHGGISPHYGPATRHSVAVQLLITYRVRVGEEDIRHQRSDTV
jgi:hypothetical protein